VSFAASDLGELGQLATALGILDGTGGFNDDWLSAPGDHLSNVLASPTQRDALVAFVDDVLGGEERETDADGLIWLPIVSHDDPQVTFYVVLDPGPANYVAIGVGARLTTSSPASLTTIHVPVFRAAKEGRSVPNAILIGTPDAVIRLTTEITLGTAPPLGGIGLALRVPTSGGSPPTFALTLTGLLLPGATQPRDLSISVSDLGELDDAVLELVLGLVRSQADALGPGGPLAAVVGLLGLSGTGNVPPLPLPQLATQGAAVLGTWFESIVASPGARGEWLGHLAALVGGTAAGDEVTLTLGPAHVAVGVRVSSGSGGHPIVTATLAVFVEANASARFRIEADLLRFDLGTGAVLALPRLAAFAHLGKRPDGGTRLLAGDPQVDAVRAGVTLDDSRRPTFLLAADGVVINGHEHATLDLSTPDAIAEAGGTLLTDVINDLLAQLGPAGDAIGLLLGLSPPAGDPGVPRLDLPAFLANPLGAVSGHWQSLVRDHAAAVPEVLTALRDLLADASRGATPVDGSGSEADPWRVPLVGPVTLNVWKGAGDTTLRVAVAASYINDTLGNGCTRVETSLAVGLAELDLAGSHATLLSSVEAKLVARARGRPRAFVNAGPITLSADHVGLRALWRPADGLAIGVVAPNVSAEVDSVSVDVVFPVLGADGTLTLDAAGWDALERLIALLAAAAPLPWIRGLVGALGWTAGVAGGDRPRLRLADVATAPADAIRAWLTVLVLDDDGRIDVALRALAQGLTGSPLSTGLLQGSGTVADPYRVPLLRAANAPEVAAWLLPNGPSRELSQAPEPLRQWRPGNQGLSPFVLDEALRNEAQVADDVAALVAGRTSIAQGLALLADRWTGTDGRIVPPTVDPAGVTVHRLPNVERTSLSDAVNLAGLLGTAPANVVEIAVVAPDAAPPWPAVPADRLIDLRAAGLAPETFALPVPAAGNWYVTLANRADARLPSGDTDGTAGQAARLQRVLAPFAALAGSTVLVAREGAGHAALAAANALPFVASLVTAGTAFSPVSFTIVDDAEAGDALRLLRWLLPPADPLDPDDDDLARGRALVSGLIELTPLADPAADLRPPSVPLAPRADLEVHACFGVIEAALVHRAITAIVAAGLATRAMGRAGATRGRVTGARVGVRVPFAAGSADLSLSGDALLELVGVDAAGRAPETTTARALTLHLEMRRPNGWLSGGPNGVDPPPTAELRWLSANVTVPLGSALPASAEIVLHEPSVFGIARERWIVRPSGSASAMDVVTTALPEVRVLLSIVAEQLSAAASGSPALAAVCDTMRGLGLMDAGGASIPDGIDHFLHDTESHVADALADTVRRAQVASGVAQALDAVPGLTVDLTARQLTLDAAGTPETGGMFAWTAHLSASATGVVAGSATLGGAGSSAAGGAVLRLDTAPFQVALEWHRAGATTPQTIPLWPNPDATALGAALAWVVPAECARAALEFVRKLDETARGVIDAALDVLGLLGAADASGRRSVLLPVGLLRDPVGWLGHASAFGGASGISPARAIGFLDALKPLTGIAGGPGSWTLAPGLSVTAAPESGQMRLALSVDTSALAPIPTAAGRLVAGGTFALTLQPDGAPSPGIDVFVGLAGAAAGQKAVHVGLNGGLNVFLRPQAGPDLPLFPNPPGLAQLSQAVVTQALPLVLDALAAQGGPGLGGQVATFVQAVGDGLNLRSGAPPKFDGARLQAWAGDPAASFVAALPTLTSTAMQAIATALQPVLPAGASAAFAGGQLTVTVNALTLTWQPAPFEVTVGGTVTGIPGVARVSPAITLDAAGLKALEATIGPAEIDAGGVTLRPFATVAVGDAPDGGRRIEIGLARDPARTKAFAARWNLGGALDLVAIDGATESTDPEQVALAILGEVLDLVASFAIETTPVQQLLATSVGATDVRNVLRGVVLEDAVNPTHLDANLFDPAVLLQRLLKLAVNLSAANPSVTIGGGLTIGLTKAGSTVKLTLGITGRVPLSQGDLVVSLEADSRWIKDQPPAGLALALLDVVGSNITFAPGFEVDGVGVRFAKGGGPLIDSAVTLGSIAVHLFGKVESTGTLSGGIQVQLSELAVAVAGAQGGNPVAQGVMKDAGSGPNRLAPSFSPALAVQKHGSGPVLVSLSAGEGSGPWWLAIQRGFGPVYIEQVGLGVTVVQDQLQKIGLLLDGRVSIFGLTAAVDDLQLTFVVASNASVFDPSRWAVDLAGFAFNADMAGLTLAGGLRKFGDGDSVEYIGMLLARFAAYGLSVFGGYGTAVVDGERFSSFFAFGAVNGPIGGPPAFFLTGIGGGLGINRALTFPDDLSRFDQFPFIKALDPAARPSDDPMAELASLRTYFPMKRGEFWFAAGISFTSFALVDGVAVVAVAIGDGLEIALLGLARLALPRPQFPLVSIELGLIARFSTKDGVFWVQAQLTDNSWLLHESVRLTGGFAFVTWFAGPNKGQFVLTIGGFHPSFHRDGYPVVPRLGFHWALGDAIVIKGESYFALTSEAVMAGGELSASAEFGPAWAHVKFGANGIVYFDPFRFDVEVYAQISAGVTIDVWIGEITISVSLGASIRVMGPKIHGIATFEVGPIELTVEFGDTSQSEDKYIGWDEFVRKYLEEAAPGVARVLTAIPGKGALPPGAGPGGATDTGTADGSTEKPYDVFSEFEITVTTTVPTETIRVAGADDSRPPSSALGIAPMKINAANSVLELFLRDGGGTDRLGLLLKDVGEPGAFPVGVWGPPQPTDDRKVPKGDVIAATDSVRFEARAQLEGTLPGEVAYYQIDPPGPRKPLPFVSAATVRATFVAEAEGVSNLLPDATGAAATYAAAKPWLATGGYGRTALAALERERAAPPRLGTLTQGLAEAEMPKPVVALPVRPVRPPVDMTIVPPRAIAVMTSPTRPERPPLRTTVDDKSTPRIAAPTSASVQAEMPLAVAARLVRLPAAAAASVRTLAAGGTVPLTRAARGAAAAVAARGAAADGTSRLTALSLALGGQPAGLPRSPGGPRADLPAAATVRSGEIAVLQMPNALRDLDKAAARPMLTVSGGEARVVALGHGGHVLLDRAGVRDGAVIPRGTERVVVLAIGQSPGTAPGVAGWHSGQELAFIGWSSALAPGAVLEAEGADVRGTRQRFRAGWLHASELVDGSTIVNTRFAQPITAIAIVLDDMAGTELASGIQLTLVDGVRPTGADGQPVPPVVVTAGNRSVLVYAVAPDPARRDTSGLTVSVARQRGVHLAGVFGSTDGPDTLAERFAQSGLDALQRPLVESAGGSVTIGWAPAPPARPPVPHSASPRPPRPAKARAKTPNRNAREAAAPKGGGSRPPRRGRTPRGA
jgi:hypothetical protein